MCLQNTDTGCDKHLNATGISSIPLSAYSLITWRASYTFHASVLCQMLREQSTKITVLVKVSITILAVVALDQLKHVECLLTL